MIVGRLAVVAAIVILAALVSAPARVPERHCQQVIASAGRALLDESLASLGSCQRRIARGALPRGSSCLTARATVRGQTAATASAGRELRRACSDADVVSLAPAGACAGTRHVADLVTCLSGGAASAAETLVAVATRGPCGAPARQPPLRRAGVVAGAPVHDRPPAPDPAVQARPGAPRPAARCDLRHRPEYAVPDRRPAHAGGRPHRLGVQRGSSAHGVLRRAVRRARQRRCARGMPARSGRGHRRCRDLQRVSRSGLLRRRQRRGRAADRHAPRADDAGAEARPDARQHARCRRMAHAGRHGAGHSGLRHARRAARGRLARRWPRDHVPGRVRARRDLGSWRSRNAWARRSEPRRGPRGRACCSRPW